MQRSLLLIVLLSSLVALSLQKGTPTNNAFFSWDGFEFVWTRQIVNTKKVGHPLGDFECYLNNEQHTTNNGDWTGKATAQMTFTPGHGEGDIAYPRYYYSAIYSPGVYRYVSEVHTAVFSDMAKSGKNNSASAESKYTIPIHMYVPKGYEQYEAILTGFSMVMTCDPSKQPQNYPCNPTSETIYPSSLKVDIEKCTLVSGPALSCDLSFDIARSITPLGGIPDDFTWAVDYKVFATVDVLVGNTSYVQFSRSSQLKESSTIYSDPTVGNEKLTLTTSKPYKQGIVAMSGFGFSLSELTIPNNGRDLNGYTFYLQNGNFSSLYTSTSGKYENTINYSYNMSVYAPVDSAPANSKMFIRPVGIFLSGEATVETNQYAQGTVCQSNSPLFTCQLNGVALDHTHTSQNFQVQDPVSS